MKSLFEFIIKHHFTALFIIFQVFNLFLIVEFNEYQRQIFFNFSNSITGSIHSIVADITGYMDLKEKNKNLSEENALLKNKLEQLKNTAAAPQSSHSFEFVSAEVVYSSTSYQNNFIIINKGTKDGIKPDMGVTGAKGVLGVTFKVSKHYTSVLSVLNTKTGISAKHKNSNYPCLVKWDGKDYRFVSIYDIPSHLKLNKGDSIVTSGFSAIFPKDIFIGTIASFYKNKNNNFYTVKVKLAENMKTVSNVNVIKNYYKAEFDSLKQNSTIDE